ncbi:MAG: hypothetical protein HY278_09830, partial [candidate division NC10 bacterium]|nr:hypothetical protein [candidate division NC10 bacterium]
MSDERWNPWKVTAIGMAVVFATALITGLVVANWVGNQKAKAVAEAPRGAVPRAGLALYPTARPSPSDV